jgi:membrane-associated phospholipid phosphatase
VGDDGGPEESFRPSRYRFAVAENVKLPLAACFACTVGLVLLAIFALGVDAGRHLDVRLFLRLVNDPRSEGGGLADAIATLGNPLPVLAMLGVACVIALLRGRPADALAATLVVAGANVTTQLLKFALAHPRVKAAIGANPFEASTFPSGHTTAIASIAIAYAFAVPARLRAPTFVAGAVLVLAVGASVVAVGWHYPSDVLGGILVALGWGFAALALVRLLAPRDGRRLGVRGRDPLPSP